MISEWKFKLKKDGMPSQSCYCRTPELIENYDKAIADTTQTWDCHHRLETHNSDGERRLVDISTAELIALGMYYDRPPEELIFLTSAEHHCLHNKGKPKSEETKKRMSKPKSEETKQKIKDATNRDAEYLNILKKIKLEKDYTAKTKTRAKQQYIDTRLQEVFGELSKTTLIKIRKLDTSN